MAQGRASGQVDVNGALLEELLVRLGQLVGNLSQSFPDTSGRTRVLLDAVTAGFALPVSTVTTVASVTNVASEGGYAANPVVPSMMQAAYNGLRAQIVVA